MGKVMRVFNDIQHPLTVKTSLEWQEDDSGRVAIDVTRPTEDEAFGRITLAFPIEKEALAIRQLKLALRAWFIDLLVHVTATNEDIHKQSVFIAMWLNILYPHFALQYRQHLASINYDIITVAHRPAEVEAIDRAELFRLWTARKQITLRPFHKTLMKAERQVMAKPFATSVKVDKTGYISHEVEHAWVWSQIQKLLGSWGIIMGVHEIRAELNTIEYAYRQSEITGYAVVYEMGKSLQSTLQKAS